MSRNVVLVIGILLSYTYGTAAHTVSDVAVSCDNLSKDNYNEDYGVYTYHPSHVNWINPDRGFYHKMSTLTSLFMPLTVEGLDCMRHVNGTILLLREYILDTNRNGSDISQDVLDKIDQDLAAARRAGWNLILRFSYTHKSHGQGSDVTEPPLDRILRHIDQLSAVLNKYPDVITTVQAGFIGRYGAWTDSSNYGPVPYTVQKLTNPQEDAFTRTIYELLASMPNMCVNDPHSAIRALQQHRLVGKNDGNTSIFWVTANSSYTCLKNMFTTEFLTRTIQIPSPGFKEQLVDPMASIERDLVLNGTKIRVGHYSDCLLSRYNNSINQSAMMSTMEYLKADTKYTVNGGETCHPVDLKDPCEETMKLFEDVHMSFVSTDHSDSMVDLWKNGGCYSQLYTNLGYNLHLNWFVMRHHAEPGESICFAFDITNNGYAAPFKATDVQLGIFNTDTQEFYSAPINADPRTWVPGRDHVIRGSVTLPANIPENNYSIFLTIGPKGAQRDDEYILLETDGIETNNSLNVLPQVNLMVKSTLQHNDNHNTSHIFNTKTARVLQSWKIPSQSNHSRRFDHPGQASNVDCRYQFLNTTSHPTGSTVVSAFPISTATVPTATPPETTTSPSVTTAVAMMTVNITKSVITTYPTSTTAPSTTQFMTTTAIPNIATCNRYKLINDIAHEVKLNASFTCPSKVFSSDQIAITYCNSSPVPSSWKPGPKVVEICQFLPHFTPIATFTNGSFDTRTDIAGVFLGCAGNGFKAAIALCNMTLSIVHVDIPLPPSSTNVIPNPDAYFVVVS